jgi:hypothetical protein
MNLPIRSLLAMLLFLLIGCSESSRVSGSDFPILLLAVNDTPQPADDQVLTGSANRIPCSIKVLNHSSFKTDLSLIIRSLEAEEGGKISFAATPKTIPKRQLDIRLPADGQSVSFFLIGDAPGKSFGDVAIEVVEQPAGAGPRVLIRKGVRVLKK